MKTNPINTGLLLITVLSVLALSSFTSSNSSTKPLVNSVTDKWEEYNKVMQYIQVQICDPIRKNRIANNGKSSEKYFSRCPSGYHPEITAEADSVKTHQVVSGEIMFYKGCSPNYVCDFKVCVSENIALVRSKGSKEYLSVDKWLQTTNPNKKTVAKR